MTVLTDIAELEADLARVRKLARDFAFGVREHYGSRCRRLRLFGSAARGDWTHESDVDVLVLLDKVESEDLKWLVDYAYDIGLYAMGILLQPIPISEERFEEMRERELLFPCEIEREGIEL